MIIVVVASFTIGRLTSWQSCDFAIDDAQQGLVGSMF
jgi:hypothetical protein